MTNSRFDTFINSVNHCLRSASHEQMRVLALRSLLSLSLSEEDFVLSCLDRAMSSMSPNPRSWHNPALHSDVELDYSIRMIYWPPEYTNNPHQHNSWTVTGVLHNKINVTIYLPDKTAESGLRIEKSFACGRGEVGYIYSPCIHSITNPANTPSVSLHIFSAFLANAIHNDNLDGGDSRQTIWYPSPLKGDIVKGIARRALTTHVEILKQIQRPESLALLDRAFDLGDLPVKLASIKAMCRFDNKHAAHKLNEVSMFYSEPLQSELIALSDRIVQSTKE